MRNLIGQYVATQQRIEDLVSMLERLLRTAEDGRQWAEVCAIEAQLVALGVRS